MTQPLLQWKRQYIGGDTPSEVFQSLVGGGSAAGTVFNALEVAARVFDEDSDEFRGIASSIACDEPVEPEPQAEGTIRVGLITLGGACDMALQFEQQAADTRRLLALLRGDDEPEDDRD